jgi:hypothetical protein
VHCIAKCVVGCPGNECVSICSQFSGIVTASSQHVTVPSKPSNLHCFVGI